MKKTVFILMIVTVISKVLGFMRDLFLSFFYGASNISDIYLISLTIPTVILAIIGKGISTGFIPMYARIESKSGIEETKRYTNNVINFVIILCTIILVLGLIFTEYLIKIFASGFEGETLDQAIIFTRISLISVYFSGLVYVYTAYLQIKSIFIAPVLMGIPSNLIVIMSIYFSSHSNVYILAFGGLIATASQFILLYIYSFKNGYRYMHTLNIKDRNIRNMILLAFPAIIGSSVDKLNLLIDRTLASKISIGGISALNYSSTLNLFMMGIVVSSITTVLYPKISKMVVQNNMKKMKETLLMGVNSINLFIIPATVGTMVFANPIVELLYGRGQFDLHALSMTSYALFFYSIGTVGIGMRDMLSNVFYSLQDTRTPMINATIAMIINIILNFILSKYLGIGGLALASSIAAIISSILLFISLRKKIGNYGMKKMLFVLMKILSASLIMGFISKYVYNLLTTSINFTLSLFISILLGAIVYIVLICLMKIEEVRSIVSEIKNSIKIDSKIKEAS